MVKVCNCKKGTFFFLPRDSLIEPVHIVKEKQYLNPKSTKIQIVSLCVLLLIVATWLVRFLFPLVSM